jgi:hypothetical protein
MCATAHKQLPAPGRREARPWADYAARHNPADEAPFLPDDTAAGLAAVMRAYDRSLFSRAIIRLTLFSSLPLSPKNVAIWAIWAGLT